MLVNVQEWVCFSIFRRADDVTQTMSKGVVLVEYNIVDFKIMFLCFCKVMFH